MVLVDAGRSLRSRADTTSARDSARSTFPFASPRSSASVQPRCTSSTNRSGYLAGGVEAMDCTLAEFAAALRQENHTLKRTLTDPRILSGIGNAYSDEILWAAQLSPIAQTQKLTDEEMARLFTATTECLRTWIDRLRAETGDGFPAKVTAFRPEMAMHGKYRQPCPRCGEPVQRIRYAANETNYCVRCQTGGKLLADRGLSRLLGKDWPRSLEDLESLKRT